MSDTVETVPASYCPTCLKLRALALLVWVAGIAILSLLPMHSKPSGVLGWDKLQHGLAYGMLAWLMLRVLVQWRGRQRGQGLYVWSVVVAFGLLMEVLQWVTHSGRSAEFYDLVADAIGALLVCVLFRHTILKQWCQQRHAGAHHG